MSPHCRVAPNSVHVENDQQCVLMCVKQELIFFFLLQTVVKTACENVILLLMPMSEFSFSSISVMVILSVCHFPAICQFTLHKLISLHIIIFQGVSALPSQ